MAQANQWPAEEALSSTIDRIVTTAPRLTIIAGTTIYYKNRDAETRRAAVLRMAEIVVSEWRGLQDAPVMTTP